MKGFVKALSVFLSMLMVLYVIPSEVYGLKTSATDQLPDKVIASDSVKIVVT